MKKDVRKENIGKILYLRINNILNDYRGDFMSKYKVGDELIIVENPTKEIETLKKCSNLNVENDFATFSWGLKILNIEYNAPEVVLTVKNARGEINKVFAVCNEDVSNFDREMVLEKALLKAYVDELIKLSTLRSNNLTKF